MKEEKEIIELLKRVLANQAVLFKRLENVEKAIKGGSRMAPLSSYEQELRKEADKLLKSE